MEGKSIRIGTKLPLSGGGLAKGLFIMTTGILLQKILEGKYVKIFNKFVEIIKIQILSNLLC